MVSKIQEMVSLLQAMQKAVNQVHWKLNQWVEIVEEGGIESLSEGELRELAVALSFMRSVLRPYSN